MERGRKGGRGGEIRCGQVKATTLCREIERRGESVASDESTQQSRERVVGQHNHDASRRYAVCTAIACAPLFLSFLSCSSLSEDAVSAASDLAAVAVASSDGDDDGLSSMLLCQIVRSRLKLLSGEIGWIDRRSCLRRRWHNGLGVLTCQMRAHTGCVAVIVDDSQVGWRRVRGVAERVRCEHCCSDWTAGPAGPARCLRCRCADPDVRSCVPATRRFDWLASSMLRGQGAGSVALIRAAEPLTPVRWRHWPLCTPPTRAPRSSRHDA